jgi:uroporphyrinogen-III synthase
MHRVLFVREQAAPLGDLLAERGFEPVHKALGSAQATGAARPALEPDAILVTSAQAVRFVSRLPAVPVHAVGSATAGALREAGIEPASVGDAGAKALVATIDPRLRLWHVGGERVAAPLESALAGRTVARWAVYRIVVPDGATEALLAALPVDAILFTSGAQVEAFAAVAAPGDARIVVLGDTADTAARAAGFAVHARAHEPRLEDLLDALEAVLGAPERR